MFETLAELDRTVQVACVVLVDVVVLLAAVWREWSLAGRVQEGHRYRAVWVATGVGALVSWGFMQCLGRQVVEAFGSVGGAGFLALALVAGFVVGTAVVLPMAPFVRSRGRFVLMVAATRFAAMLAASHLFWGDF